MNLRENSGEGNRYEENSTEENSDEKKFKNTQMLKLFFKGYKKTDRIFFLHFFSRYKNV